MRTLGACPTLTFLLWQTIRGHLRRSRPEKILNVFVCQRIRLRFFRACGLASGRTSFASSRTVTSDRLLGIHVWKFLRQHHRQCSNSKFGVPHDALRRLNPQQLLGPKRLLVKLNRVAGVLHDEAGRERLCPRGIGETARFLLCRILHGTGTKYAYECLKKFKCTPAARSLTHTLKSGSMTSHVSRFM